MRDDARLPGARRPAVGRMGLRAPRAVAPSTDHETLRRAYLDVLKLCLCDLGGMGTTSVWKDPSSGQVMSRDLTGEDLKVRAVGLDWPLHGLTMSGLARLDDLQARVEEVVGDGVVGDVIEAGAWRGGASILARATFDTLGADDRAVWVADSFAGFPAPDDRHPDPDRLWEVDFLAAGLDDVRENFARFGCERGVRFVPGFFQETMPRLTDEHWSIVRLDGDSYEATSTTLQWLYPALSVGGHVIIDDYGALEECRRAVDEFRERHGIAEPMEQIDWTCFRWRRTSDAPIARPDPGADAAATNGASRARAVPRAQDVRIPTFWELSFERERRVYDRDRRELNEQLAELRERLSAAEAEVRALHASPLRGPKVWLRRRLQRESRAS